MIFSYLFKPKKDLIKVKYFKTWGNYKLPKVPKDLISDGLDNYKTYYKAYYKNGLLIKFEKYTDSKLVSYDIYEYYNKSNKLKKQILVNFNGEKRINLYNKSGKIINNLGRN